VFNQFAQPTVTKRVVGVFVRFSGALHQIYYNYLVRLGGYFKVTILMLQGISHFGGFTIDFFNSL
jgi:hypothetical protein